MKLLVSLFTNFMIHKKPNIISQLEGKLEGKFFDSKGNPTEYYYEAQEWIKAASGLKEEEDLFKEKYPMCNVDYKPEEGSRVWCSNKR